MYEVGRKKWKQKHTEETIKCALSNYLKLVLVTTAWENIRRAFKKFGSISLKQSLAIRGKLWFNASNHKFDTN